MDILNFIKKGIVPAVLSLFVIVTSQAFADDDKNADSLVVLYNNLAVAQALNHEYDLAKAYFDSASLFAGEDYRLTSNLGNYYLCKGQTAPAIDAYRSVISADSGLNNVLFNLSIALYIADSIESSVDIMQRFYDHTLDDPGQEYFISDILDEFMADKGDAKKVSKAEIKKLLEKAKAKRDKAIAKKKMTAKKSDTKKEATENESGNKEKNKDNKKKKTSPAGEKSFEHSGITNLLYWIIL